MSRWAPPLLVSLLAGCQRSDAAPTRDAGAVETAVASVDHAAPAPDVASSPAPLARLFTDLSEPNQDFLSDNLVSNETSYLQVAPALSARARKDGAYVGVGPEQNFTYIALSEPRVAFLVDLRRGNAVEHFFYKALFDLASGRAHFLALLLGHPFTETDAATAPGPEASIDDLLAYTAARHPDPATSSDTLERVRDRIATAYGVKLDEEDQRALGLMARAFFEGQLGIAFEMHENSWRHFPSLRALLAQKGPDGEAAGFLQTERAFRLVQRMEREDRIVPIVGDFSGDRALRGVGDELRARGLTVSVFYVSNVEQYLIASPDKWRAWLRNVGALPHDDDSLFVRCYLDQGRAHPLQLRGHRTTTVLQRFDRFARDAARYRSFWDVATDADP